MSLAVVHVHQHYTVGKLYHITYYSFGCQVYHWHSWCARNKEINDNDLDAFIKNFSPDLADKRREVTFIRKLNPNE